MYNMKNTITTDPGYTWQLLRVNPKFSSQEKVLFLFLLFWTCMRWDEGCSRNTVTVTSWCMQVQSWCIKYYTLNSCRAICQLHLNKTGRKTNIQFVKFLRAPNKSQAETSLLQTFVLPSDNKPPVNNLKTSEAASNNLVGLLCYHGNLDTCYDTRKLHREL